MHVSVQYQDFALIALLRSGGIEVGRVEQLTIDQDNQISVVTVRIQKGIKVYEDAIASIKTSGLIGDKLITIDPGGGGDILKPGGTITETNSPMDIEALIGKYAFGDVKKEDKKETK